MNCNKNARIQFALHLLIIDHMSYTCTSFQWFAGLNCITYSQAFYLGESQVRFVVTEVCCSTTTFCPKNAATKTIQNLEKQTFILLKRLVHCVLNLPVKIFFHGMIKFKLI